MFLRGGGKILLNELEELVDYIYLAQNRVYGEPLASIATENRVP